MNPLILLDQKILISIQSLRRPLLNRLFLVLTYTGTGKAWLLLALVFNALHFLGVTFTSNPIVFLRCLISPLLAWALGSFFKKLFSRERPSEKIKGYKQLIVAPDCSSFPSSHAAAAISFFVTLLLTHHPLAITVGAWAILVTFSRIYLGVHYLSDVLGGTLLGCISAFAVVYIFMGG